MSTSFNPEAFHKRKEKLKRKQKRKSKNYIVARLGDKTPQQAAEQMNVSAATIRQWLYGRGVPDNRTLEWCAVTGEYPETVAPKLYPPHENQVLREYFERIYV